LKHTSRIKVLDATRVQVLQHKDRHTNAVGFDCHHRRDSRKTNGGQYHTVRRCTVTVFIRRDTEKALYYTAATIEYLVCHLS
jgi:hypothetical protein